MIMKANASLTTSIISPMITTRLQSDSVTNRFAATKTEIQATKTAFSRNHNRPQKHQTALITRLASEFTWVQKKYWGFVFYRHPGFTYLAQRDTPHLTQVSVRSPYKRADHSTGRTDHNIETNIHSTILSVFLGACDMGEYLVPDSINCFSPQWQECRACKTVGGTSP